MIGLICVGVTTMVAALAFKSPPRVVENPVPHSERSAEYPSVLISKTYSPDHWREVEDFKKGLPVLLSKSTTDPASFNIATLAQQLSEVRVGGYAVCANEEVSAEQYIQLSEVANKLVGFKSVTAQMNELLDTATGITDCQFRILDGATAKSTSIDG